MSQIAVLSDIHGNSIALQAVLQEICCRNIEECFILGDLIGYYHRPLDVLRLLEESGLRCSMIRGNHERVLEQVLQGEITWEDIRRKYGHGLDAAVQQLPQARLDDLLSLPDQRREERDGRRFLLCHGSPIDRDLYIYPDAEAGAFDFSDVEADYVLLGHTHYPMIRCGRSFCVVNPGSVGQARERGGYADWCIINTENDVITMQQTRYDIVTVLSECRQYDPDIIYLQDVLRR